MILYISHIFKADHLASDVQFPGKTIAPTLSLQ